MERRAGWRRPQFRPEGVRANNPVLIRRSANLHASPCCLRLPPARPLGGRAVPQCGRGELRSDARPVKSW